MHRRNFLRSSAIAVGAFSLAQQQWFASFGIDPWKITPLRDDLFMFTEKGGTILFYLSKTGTVVVDSQYPEQSQHLIDELKNRSKQPIKLLVNTHHHGDHTAGNISFKGITQHVLAHQNSQKNQEAAAIARKTEDKQLYPDQVYTETWCQAIGEERLCLYYFGAAHTNGDSLVHFEHSNIVHMGDLLFNRMHPFVDRSAGANMKSWVNVLESGLKKFSKKTIYVAGHAAEGYEVKCNADDVKAFRDYLSGVLDFVDKEIKAGKTKEEILKTTTLPFETTWKDGELHRPLQSAYEELSQP